MLNLDDKNTIAAKQKPLKICVGASAGGHMNELLALLENSQDWPQPPSLYITTLEVSAEKLRHKGKVYIIGECNRLCLQNVFGVILRSLKIMVIEQPDVIITTGSLPLAIACLAAKLFGAKIVWIDSIANIERFSMSGRMIRHFADLFLTQWPELAQGYNNVEYAGSLV
jgi:UDP-N-acetylglucosamine:LPS N-acetylglucosamine transferase